MGILLITVIGSQNTIFSLSRAWMALGLIGNCEVTSAIC